MLEGILPQILPGGIGYRCVVFEGKQDLEKRLPKRLRGWQHIEETKFIVLRDQDSADCRLIKQRLIEICREAGRPETLVRIACRELESFYLGDLAAVGQAFDKANLGKQQKGKKFRNPDMLSNPVQELQKLVPDYQKLSGSRKIASQMKIDANRSESFNDCRNQQCCLHFWLLLEDPFEQLSGIVKNVDRHGKPALFLIMPDSCLRIIQAKTKAVRRRKSVNNATISYT